MKKVIASCFIVGMFAGAAIAGQPAATGVNGSAHDMNVIAGASADSMDRVCVFCHTPHFAAVSDLGDNLPLWNRDLTTAPTYTPYTWATPLNAGDGAANDFTIVGNQAAMGPSRLCLSCHDGTIAPDQHNGSITNVYGNGAQAGTLTISARANIGTDLSDDHPIGFDYVSLRAYREAHSNYAGNPTGSKEIADVTDTFAESVTPSAVGGTFNTVTRYPVGSRTIGDVLYQGTYMTCASCHEVHNKENVVQDFFTGVNGSNVAAQPNFFLYAKETDSLICLSCHIK